MLVGNEFQEEIVYTRYKWVQKTVGVSKWLKEKHIRPASTGARYKNWWRKRDEQCWLLHIRMTGANYSLWVGNKYMYMQLTMYMQITSITQSFFKCACIFAAWLLTMSDHCTTNEDNYMFKREVLDVYCVAILVCCFLLPLSYHKLLSLFSYTANNS